MEQLVYVADSFPKYCWKKVEGSVVTVVGNDSILSFHSVMFGDMGYVVVCQCHKEWRITLAPFWCLVKVGFKINKLTTYHTSQCLCANNLSC